MLNNDRCPYCHQMSKRTRSQNNLQWAILRMVEEQLAVKGKHFGAAAWDEYFKERFLGKEEFELPNGKIITRTRGTSSLNKEEMETYITKLLVWCADHDVVIPDFESHV